VSTRYRTGIQPHLLERDAEQAELRAAVDGTLAGEGALVVIEGSAGAGKSALVAAASSFATASGLQVLTARGSELEREFAFGAIRQLFEPLLTAATPADRRKLLAGAAAPAGWVTAPADPGGPGPARPEAAFAALHAIHWLAANVATHAPLLIAVDDLHWVDESSVRALSYLGRRIGDLPIALIVALRPAEPGAPAALLDDLRGQPGITAIAPATLSARAVTDVVHERIPAADDALCDALYTASAGNPLYLHELLRTISGVESPSAAIVREASVPTLADRVNRRVARVAPQAPALTAAMAVLGDGGRLASAAALAGLSEHDAAGIAHRLRRIEILAGEDPFAFVHPLVRRSVYDGLSVTERDAAHSAAAELLREAGAPVEAIAAHLAAVRPSGSPAIAATLMRAADEALSRAAPEAAVRWLHRALAEAAPEPARAVLLFAAGRAEMVLRDPASVAHLQEALDLASEPNLRAQIVVALSELLMALGQWESGSELIAQAIAGAGHDPELVVELEVIRALTAAYDPRLVETFDRGRARFEELARGDGWAAHALTMLLASVSAFRGERVAEVAQRVEHGFWNGRLLAERGAGGWATSQGLGALVCADEYDRAIAMADVVAAEGRRTGAMLAVLSGPGYRGHVHSQRGDLAAAEAELRPVVDMLLDTGMSMWIATVFHMFQDAILERPGLDDIATLAETLDTEPVFLATSAGAMLLECRGLLRLPRGDREGAVADLRACAATNAALKMAPTFSSWRSSLALALPAADREEARQLVADELELARTIGLPRPLGIALRASGMLEGGEARIELLRQSVSVLESSEAKLERARSLVELGGALRRRQQRAEARQHLAAGMDLAYRCGAPRLVARAEDELRAAGAKPRRIAQSGTDALTASELRVGLLAARGRSNSEIAQELYVSLKTIETHLSHAYAKLGLSGQGARKRLAEALGA
jgi:DNA-binding CsgD family transcriptional regulator